MNVPRASAPHGFPLRHVRERRSHAAQILEMTILASEEVRRFGLTPKVALVSHSNFGSSDAPSAVKMREALALIERTCPTWRSKGEMQGRLGAFRGGAHA
jgi:phosphotransacetylase